MSPCIVLLYSTFVHERAGGKTWQNQGIQHSWSPGCLQCIYQPSQKRFVFVYEFSWLILYRTLQHSNLRYANPFWVTWCLFGLDSRARWWKDLSANRRGKLGSRGVPRMLWNAKHPGHIVQVLQARLSNKWFQWFGKIYIYNHAELSIQFILYNFQFFWMIYDDIIPSFQDSSIRFCPCSAWFVLACQLQLRDSHMQWWYI